MLISFVPAAISFVSVTVLCPFLIIILKKLQLTQPIRKELPADHQLKKGTPLMTGSIFLVGIFVALLYKQNPLMIFLATTFMLFSFIGFFR